MARISATGEIGGDLIKENEKRSNLIVVKTMWIVLGVGFIVADLAMYAGLIVSKESEMMILSNALCVGLLGLPTLLWYFKRDKAFTKYFLCLCRATELKGGGITFPSSAIRALPQDDNSTTGLNAEMHQPPR